MKHLTHFLVVVALLSAAPRSRAQPPNPGDDKAIDALQEERAKLAKRLAELDAQIAQLAKLKEQGTRRYVLPVQDLSVLKPSAPRWGLAAPIVDEFSDPNRIVYDQAYLDAYFQWAADTPTICGAASYAIALPDKVIQVHSGLDESYLGRRFRADDLIAFLKTRADGKTVERAFRIGHPEAVKVLRVYPESHAARRLRQSPWDRDTQTVVGLLALARYKPAYPVLKALLKDPVLEVRSSAAMALGHLAPVVPEAVKELARLLPDKELGAEAADGLMLAGAAGVPALVAAMDHPDGLVRNRAVFALARLQPFEAAVPGLLAAVDHKDKTIRKWGLSVVIDMQGRGVSLAHDALIDALARRLADGDTDTRVSSAIALVNLKAAAARVRPALLKAAGDDEDDTVRRYAREALQAIDQKK